MSGVIVTIAAEDGEVLERYRADMEDLAEGLDARARAIETARRVRDGDSSIDVLDYDWPEVGMRFVTSREVRRETEPPITVPEGYTGTVVSRGRTAIWGELDKPVPGAEPWRNRMLWDGPWDFFRDVHELI